jgi:predicted MPP superfamily phosphohydrolase
MILFFTFFVAIYGSVHVYAFFRTRSALGLGPGGGFAFAAFLLAMTLAPVLIRLVERCGFELTARVLSYVAYLWMAVLFFYFGISLLFDAVGLITRLMSWISPVGGTSWLIPEKTSFLISMGLSLSICIYGYFEAKDIRTERLVLETSKLPANTDRLTIVQLSDMHLGLINRSGRLAPMLAAAKAAHPDILVVTGDLVDAQINHLTGLAGMFREIKPTYGKFAIMGNHEYYAGTEKALAFIREAGFTLLRNEAVVSGPITLVGVDDRTGVQLKLRTPFPEQTLFAGLSRDTFTVLLKHQPCVDNASLGLFDLQLSGHTHKGQLFPFTWLTLLSYPMNAGRYDLDQGSILYVNRGAGTWGPPIRFLAPPEVTVIELKRT